MSDLLDAVKRATTDRSDPVVAGYLALASPDERRAIWALSIVVELAPSELSHFLEALWGEASAGSWDEIVVELMQSPLVLGRERVRIEPTASSTIAQDFATNEPDVFTLAHEMLARLEAAREETEADDYESWLSRGRLAFYLAGTEPDGAVEQFGRVFADAPSIERTACRIWVSSLVLRQEALLSEQRRAVLFYSGFRAYVMGERAEARRAFEGVIADDTRDLHQAIALHLLGVMLRDRDPDRAIELLHESIALSVEIGLHDNEVMARASLAWAYITRAQLEAGPATEDIELAQARAAQRRLDAEAALAAARESARAAMRRPDDLSLTIGTRYVASVAEWLVVTDNRRARPPEARAAQPRLDQVFRQVMEDARDLGEIDTFIVAGNQDAGLFVDTGDYDAALARLSDVIAEIEPMSHPPARIQQLGKTLRRILALSRGSEVDREHALYLLERVEDLSYRVRTGTRPSRARELAEVVDVGDI